MRLLRSLRDERGIALPVALGVMLVLSISIVAAVEMSSSGQRSADRSKASNRAYNFAEAGLAEAFSIIEAAANPTTLPNFSDTKQLDGGGEVTYSASYVQPVWTITSTGSVPNPTGPGSDVTRTLNQTATVQPLVPGATAPEWDRLFHNRTDICLTIDTVTIPASVTSAGDLCLIGTGKITGARSGVEVGDDVRMTGTSTSTQDIQRFPSTGSTPGSPPDPGWTSPGNIVSNNNQRASDVIAGSSDGLTLDATGFGFTLPANATIEGIEARVERYASSSSSVRDLEVYLLKDGVPVGTNEAATSSNWSTSSDSTRDYGADDDLWGTTWTASDINASNFGFRLRARNVNSSSRTAFVDYIRIEVWYRPESVVNASIGESGSPITRAEVVGTCQKGSSGPFNTPCGEVDNVYANSVTTNPPNLTKPQVDMQYWYDNAKPGPKYPCTTGSFPGGFDNDTTMNNSLPDYGNDNESIDQLTPSFISYSCKVIEDGEQVGELSWNHTTGVLTLDGTIFIDGDVRFDKEGDLINYNGRAIMYAGGDLEFDEIVCAGGDGTNNCLDDMSNWDPEENMLIILSNGWSEYDQGNDEDENGDLFLAAFQGVMYAQDNCLIHENFRSSGPILCDEIQIENDTGVWPTFYEWPELQSLIAGQMYGSFANAADYALILGNQTG